MIIVSDRKLLIPSGEKHIGFTGDNLVEERVFAINNKKIFDLEFRIDLQNTGETIVLGKRISGDGKLLFLTWEITSGVLTTTPMIEFQLRGFEPEGERVWHSEKNSFYTDSSIDASNELTPEEIDEFHVIEKQVALYRNQAEEFCSQSEENCLEAQGLRNESEAFRNEAQGFMEQAQEFRNEAKDLAQQSLADYTELKENVYTKDETDTKIASDINAVIVQDVGEDETKVMSQKAVTEGLMRFDEVINTHIDEVVNNKADADKVYTKDEIDVLLSKKRDNDDFTPIAGAEKEEQERISLIGITTVTAENMDIIGPAIEETYLEANGGYLQTFFVNVKGNVTIEIDATGFMYSDPADGDVFVDGIKLEPEIVSSTECKYYYSGEITNGITLQGYYLNWDFTTFRGNVRVYSDGFMSGEQAEKLDTLESQIGDIETALDELHTYAQALISGGEA